MTRWGLLTCTKCKYSSGGYNTTSESYREASFDKEHLLPHSVNSQQRHLHSSICHLRERGGTLSLSLTHTHTRAQHCVSVNLRTTRRFFGLCMFVRVCMRAYVRASVRACVRVRVCVCVLEDVKTPDHFGIISQISPQIPAKPSVDVSLHQRTRPLIDHSIVTMEERGVARLYQDTIRSERPHGRFSVRPIDRQQSTASFCNRSGSEGTVVLDLA